MVILDTKSPFAILTTLSVMIAVAFTYWTFISSAGEIENIKYQKELWKEKEPSSYFYSVYNGCMFVQKSEVIVPTIKITLSIMVFCLFIMIFA